jgi:hypothetical protein
MTARTVQSRKEKGRKLQQKIAIDIQETYGLSEFDVVSRPMGSPGLDIMLSEKARAIFPFGIESKWHETLAIWNWAKQCCRNSDEDALTPLLIVKYNYTPKKSWIWAIMRYQDYSEIFSEYEHKYHEFYQIGMRIPIKRIYPKCKEECKQGKYPVLKLCKPGDGNFALMEWKNFNKVYAEKVYVGKSE